MMVVIYSLSPKDRHGGGGGGWTSALSPSGHKAFGEYRLCYRVPEFQRDDPRIGGNWWVVFAAKGHP